MTPDSSSHGASRLHRGHDHRHTPAEMRHHLLSEERMKWQDPEKILDAILLPGVCTVVELGCGPGYFTLPMARRIGDAGTVIGVDVNAELLAMCRRRMTGAKIHNFELLLLDADEPLPLGDACADLIFAANVLHDFRRPQAALSEARRLLKKDGLIVDIDWKKEELPFGPPPEVKFSTDRSSSLLVEAGFVNISVTDIGPFHYCVRGTK